MQKFPKIGLQGLLRPEDSIVVLIDHQPFQVANLHSHEPTLIINNTVGLAKATKVFNVPTILTTVTEERGGYILKGIQDVEDAHLAVATGADAIIVSNHGGRQLDGADSTINALPKIVDAVGHKIEVHMDGGIRSGQDVLKAYALGAKGTYIGRSFLYGLGAMGQAGVTKALEIIHKELDITMAFCGHTDIKKVDSSILLPGTLPSSKYE